MAAAPGKGSSRAGSFLARLTSTVLLWGVVVAVFLSGSRWGFAVAVGVVGGLGVIEYVRLTRGVAGSECRLWGMMVGFAYLGVLSWQAGRGSLGATGFVLEAGGLAAVLVGSFALRLRHPIEGDESVRAVNLALFGFVYIPVLFAGFMTRLGVLPPAGVTTAAGLWLILLVVLITKFTDMGAYLVGSLCGKHKAIPHISPAKSWEGYVGSLFFAQAGGLGVYFLGAGHFGWLGGVSHVVVLGFLLAVAAMLGDLAESILKRSLHVKDSSHVLPGIGGILDLIDSLCFSLPVAYFYLHFVVL